MLSAPGIQAVPLAANTLTAPLDVDVLVPHDRSIYPTSVSDDTVVVHSMQSDTLLEPEREFSGMVFEDLDRDGARDAGEPGLAGWTVELQQVGTSNTPSRTFANPTPDEWSQFGRFVAAVGANVLIGSHYDDASGFADAGAAYLYDGSTGEPLRTYLNPTPAEGDKFGRAVAGAGSQVLIGAPSDDTAEEEAGAAYLFDAETGQLRRTFLSPNPREDDQFGRAVAAVGDKVLVGARFADIVSENGTTVEVEDSGAAFLFAGETGQLLQTYFSPTPTENAQFGYCVAGMGDNVLIGARYDETGADGVGAVYLFDGATGGVLQTFQNPTQRATGDPSGFGRSVAAVGDNVLVGARWDDAAADGAGAAFLFDGANGRLLHTFTSPTPFAGEEFGFSVAALGEDVLVGARWDNRWDELGDGNGGAAYLFDGTTGGLLQTIANPAPGAWDGFGICVAAADGTAFVGTQTGNAVYSFETVSASTTTSDNGNYLFPGLEAGTYRIAQSMLEGYAQTIPAGSGNYTVALEGGSAFSGLHFGNVRDDPPVANNDSYRVTEDRTLTVPTAGGLLANDTDADGDLLTASTVHAPRHGTLLLLPDGSFTYTPDQDFAGTDLFTYRANDGVAESGLATVVVTVEPVNDVPVASENGLWVLVNTARRVEAPGVLANDFDVDGDLLTASLISPPSHGAVLLHADGSYVYTPDSDYAGPDSFVYRANDGTLDSNPATVQIAVSINLFDAIRDSLCVTELNYHPYSLTPEERALGIADREAFEFIELQNIGDESLDLAGVQIGGAVQFQFLGETLLDPGEYGVIVRDRTAFEARYGGELNVLGEYRGDLHNSGEQISMRDPHDLAIVDFCYRDGDDWPNRADGLGATLEIINPRGDYSDGSNWNASVEYGGSPGAASSGPAGTVVINEVLTHSNLPLTDSVELYNTTGESIELSGWYLSDSANDLKKFRVPDGTIIAADGYVVFDEHDFNRERWNPGSGGFAFDSALGDDVWLTTADADGNLEYFVDHVEFDAALNGESFGRWPNGEGDLYPMRNLTLGSENSDPRIGPVLISEVMYHPPDLDESVELNDLEYIEIYNPLPTIVDLTNWRIQGGVEFDFAEDTRLPAGATIVVVEFDPHNAAALRSFRDHYHSSTATAEFVGPLRGNLDDDGDTVRLMRPDFPPWWEPHHVPWVVEDEVRYSSEDPWPTSANGHGNSLHRRGIDQWGIAATSWAAASPSPGAIDLHVGNLAIAEINYHPHDPTPAELAVDPSFLSEDFEFIELLNIAGRPIDLSGIRLTEGVLFDLPDTTLTPGQRIVVVHNRAAFRARYGNGAYVSGEFIGSLSNRGERITIASADQRPILSFSYSDASPWPDRADGDGSSLEMVNVHGAFGNGENWRASSEYGGSPGHEGVGPAGEVVVNEVLAGVDDPLGDRLELHNTTGGPIDIGGWYLSDSGGDPGKFRIPDGTILEGHAYVVFTGSDLGATPANPGFTLNRVHGGDVFLLRTDAVGDVTSFADHVRFGAARSGESFGRWPDGHGDLYPMIIPTFHPTAGENSGPRVGPVVISEVMYHPRDPGEIVNPDNLEYVEIYNPTSETVDLANWQIRGGIQFDFGEGTLLSPREALLVVRFDPVDANMLSALRLHYGIRPWVDIVGGYSDSLSNRGDRVQLLRVDEALPDDPGRSWWVLEDEVVFDDEPPWSTTADGYGHSLHRRAMDLWGNEAVSWIAGPSSPGMVDQPISPLAITELNYHPYDPTEEELAANASFQRADFEFIELLNIAGEVVDLEGIRFTEGIVFEFPSGTLDPGERVVIVNTLAAFSQRYGTRDIFLAGQYGNALSDEGEQITLADGSGAPILSFQYSDRGEWPSRAAGRGSSLELVDPAGYHHDPDVWRDSNEYGGSPGSVGRGSQPNVVINEVLANTAVPLLDTIELYNTTDQPIDVGGWYLSNSGDNYQKFRIPQGVILAAGGFLVFDERDFNPNGEWNPQAGPRAENEFSLDGDAGDDVWLLEAVGQRLTRFADHVQFGMAAVGRSFGCWPDGQGEFLTLVFPTLDRDRPEEGENSSPQLLASLVVSELNYNPQAPNAEEAALGIEDNDDFEFIELQNVGRFPFDLTGLRLVGGIEFGFTGSGVVELAPGEFVVVVRNAAAFVARYGEGINVAGQYRRRLSDNGEEITLMDQFSQTVFSVRYDNNGTWPYWPDGHGASLELTDPTAVPQSDQERAEYLNEPANWRPSGEPGGTPGATGAGPRNGVVINEVLSYAEYPLLDAIELYNTSDEDIPVGGWYLSNTAEDYQKFRFPDGSILPAHGYLTFDEQDFNPNGPWNPHAGAPGEDDFTLDTTGDEVWLMETIENGSMRFVDHVVFPAAACDESFGRWPDGQGDLHPMVFPTLDREAPEDGENSGPRVGPLIISEIHYNSDEPDDRDNLEFVELYNPTWDSVDLSEWRLTDGIAYTFSAGTEIRPQSALVVLSFNPDDAENAEQLMSFRATYGISESVTLVGGYRGRLSNGGERVRLERWQVLSPDDLGSPVSLLEDEVAYDDHAPWPIQADGRGGSLHRLGTGLWGHDPASWTAAGPSPGTVEISEDTMGHLIIHGTDSDDLFEFTSGDICIIALNGVESQYSADEIRSVVFDGRGGNDTAVLHGGDGNETVEMWPDSGQLVRDGLVVHINNVATITADGGSGFDTATFHDSAGDDTLTSWPNGGLMIGFGKTNRAVGFDAIFAYASVGGQDTVRLYDSPGNDHFLGTATYGWLHGDGFSVETRYFEVVHAFATAGGVDEAKFYDSADDDCFVAAPTVAAMYIPGVYYSRAKYFNGTHAYATAGGIDVAKFVDSPANDDFVGAPTYAALYNAEYQGEYTKGFCNRVNYFEGTHAYATAGGVDLARLYDSPDDDIFYADPTHGALYIPGKYYDRAAFFEGVHAYATAGGRDVARLHGSQGSDRFYRDPAQCAMYIPGQYFNRSKFFEESNAYGHGGDDDQAILHDSALEDLLEAEGNWVRLTNSEPDSWCWVSEFDCVNAIGTAGTNTKDMKLPLDFALEFEGAWHEP